MTLSLVLASTAMAAPQPQNFKLKYLSEVTHGHVIHTVDVKAQDFNDALTKSRSLCLKGLLDRHVASEDIVDMCANPRL